MKTKNSLDAEKDLWSLDDTSVVLENFLKALKFSITWSSWVVDRKDYKKVWISFE
ncbi:MAG: hypothetical protein JNL11_05540 [Bdellovibrionaceae bacterium]|nr:hypothetical protein [Pseudobdellovibrionaceae bacterium]